jgi:hypothetical protein
MRRMNRHNQLLVLEVRNLPVYALGIVLSWCEEESFKLQKACTHFEFSKCVQVHKIAKNLANFGSLSYQVALNPPR